MSGCLQLRTVYIAAKPVPLFGTGVGSQILFFLFNFRLELFVRSDLTRPGAVFVLSVFVNEGEEVLRIFFVQFRNSRADTADRMEQHLPAMVCRWKF